MSHHVHLKLQPESLTKTQGSPAYVDSPCMLLNISQTYILSLPVLPVYFPGCLACLTSGELLFCRRPAERLQVFRKAVEPLFNEVIESSLWKIPVSVPLPRLHASQYLKPLVHVLYGVYGELAVLYRVNDLALEHQVPHISLRYYDALRPGQPLCLADLEEALDLLVHPAYGLDLSPLVHGAGHCYSLVKRLPGQARVEGVNFSTGRAVAFYLLVQLLEGYRRRERERELLSEPLAKEAGEDHERLVVYASAHLHFPLYVNDAGVAHEDLCGDPRRLAKGVVSGVENGKAVYLPYHLAAGGDHYGVLGYIIPELIRDL